MAAMKCGRCKILIGRKHAPGVVSPVPEFRHVCKTCAAVLRGETEKKEEHKLERNEVSAAADAIRKFLKKGKRKS